MNGTTSMMPPLGSMTSSSDIRKPEHHQQQQPSSWNSTPLTASKFSSKPVDTPTPVATDAAQTTSFRFGTPNMNGSNANSNGNSFQFQTNNISSPTLGMMNGHSSRNNLSASKSMTPNLQSGNGNLNTSGTYSISNPLLSSIRRTSSSSSNGNTSNHPYFSNMNGMNSNNNTTSSPFSRFQNSTTSTPTAAAMTNNTTPINTMNSNHSIYQTNNDFNLTSSNDNGGLRQRYRSRSTGRLSLSSSSHNGSSSNHNMNIKRNGNKLPPPKKSQWQTNASLSSSSSFHQPIKENLDPNKNNNHSLASSSLTQSHPSIIQQNSNYSTWVIIHGINSNQRALWNTVLQKFSSLGTIVKQYPKQQISTTSSSTTLNIDGMTPDANTNTTNKSQDTKNWICLQYGTNLQAEKALCQDGYLIRCGNDVAIIGVRRLDEKSANQIGWMRNQDLVSDYSYTNTTLVSDGNEMEDPNHRSSELDSINNSNDSDRIKRKEHSSHLWKEEDILLSDHEIRGSKKVLVNGGQVDINRENASVCDKVIQWVFGW